jgi:hypothetical protein
MIVYMYRIVFPPQRGLRLAEAETQTDRRDRRPFPNALSNPYYPAPLPALTTARVLVGRSYKHPDAPANADYIEDTEIRDGRRREHNLPLFGKRSDVSRSKYQYYTMSNTGVVNTKPRSTRTTGSVPASRVRRDIQRISVFVDDTTARSMRRFTRRICCGIQECELSNC